MTSPSMQATESPSGSAKTRNRAKRRSPGEVVSVAIDCLSERLRARIPCCKLSTLRQGGSNGLVIRPRASSSIRYAQETKEQRPQSQKAESNDCVRDRPAAQPAAWVSVRVRACIRSSKLRFHLDSKPGVRRGRQREAKSLSPHLLEATADLTFLTRALRKSTGASA